MEAIQPRYRLGKITNKFLILDIIFSSFFRKNGLTYLFQGCKIFRTLLKENYKAAKFMSKEALKDFEERVSRSLLHRNDLHCTTSQVDLPDNDPVYFVYLSEDKLYTEADKTLYVYSLSDLTSPCATYPLDDDCHSALITENRLYLGGWKKLHIFEVTPSLTEPLTPVTQTPTENYANVLKILRVGDDLLLG
jgi:hypothetical protein